MTWHRFGDLNDRGLLNPMFGLVMLAFVSETFVDQCLASRRVLTGAGQVVEVVWSVRSRVVRVGRWFGINIGRYDGEGVEPPNEHRGRTIGRDTAHGRVAAMR